MTVSHKKIIVASLFTIFLVFTSGIIIDESFAETPDLFTKVSVIQQSSLSVESSAILDSETVTIDLSILDNETINVTLFDKTYTFTLDYLDEDSPDNYTWFGSNDNGNAIITVQGGKLVATINTPDGNFVVDANEDNYNHQVKSVALGELVESPHTFAQTITQSSDDYYMSNIAEVVLTHDRFRPSNLEELDTVYVSVYIGYTKAVADKYGSTTVDRKLVNEIKNANYANKASNIPVEFISAGFDDYRYTEGSTIDIDKDNLLVHTNNVLDDLRDDANDANADILILITEPSVSIDDYLGCGVAGGIIAKNPDDSIAVVVYECLDGITLTHEMGHLFGAGHNRDYDTFGTDISPFGQFSLDGYGYYDTNVNMRTVMSYDCDSTSVDYPDEEDVIITCRPDEVWSDPDVWFQGTATPTGNDDNYNARAIFGAGPYIASMQGEEQKYDSTSPLGDFEWLDEFIDKIFNQGTSVSIGATFNEPIHDDYPPTVTISDSTITSDVVMSKSTSTSYTATHQLTTEVGEVTLKFSNAKDLYLNDIVTDPISGGTIVVVEPTTTPGSPTSLQATPGNSKVILDWIAPTDDGGDTITDYLIEYKLSSEPTTWSTFVHGNTTIIETVTGLTNDSSYDFRVSATNGVGTGSASSIVTVTPVDTNPPDYSVTSILPTSGNTAKVGDNIVLTLTAGSLETGLESSGTQIINGVNSTFAESGSGVYTITYIVSEGDISILDSAEIPVNITLKDSAGNVGTTIITIHYDTAPGIDANSPVFSTAVTDSTTQISITTDQIIYDNSAEYGDFTLYGVSGGSIDSIVLVSDTIITLNIAGATISDGDMITIDYTRTIGSINDIHGNVLQNFTDKSITNNLDTTPPTSIITTTSLTTIQGTATDDFSGVYKVEVSTDNGSTFSDATGTTAWIFDISGLSDNTYSIVVRTIDNAGNTDTTTLLSLTISRQQSDSTVSATILLNPINGSSVPIIPILDWTVITDTDLPTYPYTVMIATDSSFNNIIDSSAQNNVHYYISEKNINLVDGNTYYWKVITRDIINNTASSEIRSFTYDVTAPVGSIVITGISSTDSTITIDWQANSYNENNIKKVLFYVNDSDLNLIVPSNLEYKLKGIRGLQETFGSTTITTIDGTLLTPGTEYFVQLSLDIRFTPNDNVYSGMIPITTTS